METIRRLMIMTIFIATAKIALGVNDVKNHNSSESNAISSTYPNGQFQALSENEYNVMYDGVCPAGLSRYDDYDCAIKDFTNARVLPIKDISDYSNVIYIDPTATDVEDGTYEHPFNSWKDIGFTSNYAYVQKAGTTYSSASIIEIPADKDNVYIGSYGTGTKPVIIMSVAPSPTFIVLGSEVQIVGLEIQGAGDENYRGIIGNAIIYARGGSDNLLVFNCTLREGYQGFMSWSNNNRVINTEIYNMYSDGIWLSKGNFTEISYINMHDINTAYNLTGHGIPGDGQGGEAGGDGIQFVTNNFETLWVHHSTIDRSNSGNKFCLLAEPQGMDDHQSVKTIVEFNTFIGNRVDVDSRGGASVDLCSGSNHKVFNNYFKATQGTLDKGVGFWNESPGDSVIGNVFNGYKWGMNGGTIDNIITSHNTFYNNDVDIYGAHVLLYNNIFHVTSGEVAFSFCTVIGEGQNMFEGETALGSSYSGVCNFVNPASDDFHLQSTSIAINKGKTLDYRYFDKDQKLINGTPDIGAYEYDGLINVNEPPITPVTPEPPVTPETPVINNAPIINDQEFLIKKAEFKNNYIGKIIASDIDAEQRLTYSIDSGNESGKFKLNNLTGEITANTTNLFSQITTTFNLTVKATDNGPDEKSSMAKVKISFLAEELSVTMITDPELMVYPNPSSGPFSVSINIPKEPELSTNDIESSIVVPKMELNVVSISGKTLLTRLLDQTGTLIQETFDLTGIPNGFYFIVLKTAYKLYTEKLIITQ